MCFNSTIQILSGGKIRSNVQYIMPRTICILLFIQQKLHKIIVSFLVNQEAFALGLLSKLILKCISRSYLITGPYVTAFLSFQGQSLLAIISPFPSLATESEFTGKVE